MSDGPIIIPVASGKGGVGKTLISVNLGFALAQQGKKTILIDLDFGGANVHTCMGYDAAPDGIGNFLNQRTLKLEDYMLTTANRNLFVIPGDAEMVGIADISSIQKKKLMAQILTLDADYVILDLGAGSSNNTIDFFMMSPFTIIVAMPELTSILNAYALLKSSIFRVMYMELKGNKEIRHLFNRQLKKGGETAWKVSQLLNSIFDIDPELHIKAVAMLEKIVPRLVINMAATPKDIEMGERLRKIAKNYLSVDIEYIGFLYRDQDVNKSILSRTPLAIQSPGNQTYQTLLRIAAKVLNSRKTSTTLYNINHYENSYEEVLDEATDDLSGRIEGYEELADENLLTINELIALIKNMEYENLALKKQVEELKYQLLRYKK